MCGRCCVLLCVEVVSFLVRSLFEIFIQFIYCKFVTNPHGLTRLLQGDDNLLLSSLSCSELWALVRDSKKVWA